MFHATGLTLFWFSFVKQFANCGLRFISTDGSYTIHCSVPQDIKRISKPVLSIALVWKNNNVEALHFNLARSTAGSGLSCYPRECYSPGEVQRHISARWWRALPSAEQREAVKANISQDLRTLLWDVHVSLQDSNFYHCGGLGTGWARIAYLNMSELTQQCPQNWSLITSPRRTCGRSSGVRCSSPNVPCTCDSATFNNHQGIQYSQLCGRVIGYRVGSPEGFRPSHHLRGDIDSAYAEGVSITHGSPRQHIWTFASTRNEVFCPCARFSTASSPPFVGNDYFCEVGDPPYTSSSVGNFYPNDPLWDGDGCKPSNTCCTFNNPPSFHNNLTSPTTDSIEVRLCADNTIADENFAIELIEIYIKWFLLYQVTYKCHEWHLATRDICTCS